MFVLSVSPCSLTNGEPVLTQLLQCDPSEGKMGVVQEQAQREACVGVLEWEGCGDMPESMKL